MNNENATQVQAQSPQSPNANREKQIPVHENNSNSVDVPVFDIDCIMSLPFNGFALDLQSTSILSKSLHPLHEDHIANLDPVSVSLFRDLSFDDDLYF